MDKKSCYSILLVTMLFCFAFQIATNLLSGEQFLTVSDVKNDIFPYLAFLSIALYVTYSSEKNKKVE
ncbi:hypothetical protein [Macrococcus capreoli]|uniref:hypothetical protein n=1 Tax=Macrococcus capreoli TaxID=2982690 RepID=UPI003EE55B04